MHSFNFSSLSIIRCPPSLAALPDYIFGILQIGKPLEIKNTSPYLEIKVVFSKCPLSREPVEIIINTKMTDKNMDKDVFKFIESIVPSKFINKYKYDS